MLGIRYGKVMDELVLCYKVVTDKNGRRPKFCPEKQRAFTVLTRYRGVVAVLLFFTNSMTCFG